MSDYRVTIKVRNNLILKAIKNAGGEPGLKWCQANGLAYGCVNDLINLTASPIASYEKNGEGGGLRPIAIKLCEVLNAIPDDLWSSDQLRPLEKNFTELEMTQEQVQALLPSQGTQYIQDFGADDAHKTIENAMSDLTERENKLLHYRFYEEKTLEECGEIFAVTRSRIRQIEEKALRKLRHPSRAKKFLPMLEGREFENLKNRLPQKG